MERTYKTADDHGRRRKDVQARIDKFILKIKSIDDDYLPLKSLKKKDAPAYSRALATWRKKIQDACSNEKKYLAVEERLQVSSYKKLVTRYRNALKELNFIHPKYGFQLDALEARHKTKKQYLEPYRTDVADLRQLLRENKALLSTELRDKPNERWAYSQVVQLDYEHPAIKYIRLSNEQMAIFKQDSVTNLAERQKKDKRTRVPYNAWNLVFSRIASGYKTADYADLTLALMWFTGRRPVEILKLGELKEIAEGRLLFSGQAKTKGKSCDPYEIPVQYDSSVLVKMLKRVRKLKDFTDDTGDQINGRTSATLNARVKKHFDNDNLEAYDLRRAYGVYTEMLVNKNEDTRSKYIGQILGHTEKDINTARSYDTVIVDMSGPGEDEIVRKEIDAEKERKNTLLERLAVMESDGSLKTKAFVKIHAKVIEMVQRGDTKFNISRIGEYSGCNRLAIKNFLTKVDLSL